MRNFFIYIAALSVASAAVFLLVFGLGRRPSLEQEMARRAYRQREDRTLSIPSLKPAETEEPGAAEDLPPPEVVNLTEDVTVTRFPLDAGGVVLLLDPELVPGQFGGVPPHVDFRRGLENFFRRMPSSFLVGMRALAAEEEGSCGETALLQPFGAWSPDELLDAAERGVARGPRSLASAMEDAAAEPGTREGAQAIVVVTAGEERCGGSPCQTAAVLQEVLRPARVFVVLLWPGDGDDPLEPSVPPPWLSRMECIAERGGGELFRVSTALGLESALLRIVTGLQPNVTVRAFHSAGREITGANVEDRDTWGVAIAGRGESEPVEAGATSFPVTLTLPEGEYELRIWYGGMERIVQGLEVASGERLEIEANFRAGELYLQPKDGSGQELVGDTADLDCFWGTEVFREEDLGRDYGTSCTFPAYYVLEPGTYTVRAWKGTSDIWLEDVKVTEGDTAVMTAVFAEGEHGGEGPPEEGPPR